MDKKYETLDEPVVTDLAHLRMLEQEGWEPTEEMRQADSLGAPLRRVWRREIKD